MVKARKDELPRLALLVHSNVAFLTALQHSFEARGIHSVVARDLPTALLALNQHDFGVAVIHSRITEEGDGWALAGVVRRLFVRAHVAVTCEEKSVLSLQSTINHGLNQLFDKSCDSDQVVSAVLAKIGGAAEPMVQ
jgi:ActR/RegA family two-component response regulator